MSKINTLANFLASNQDGVFLPGHAGALIKMGSELILCDPCWNSNPYENFFFFPKQYDCTEVLSKITACIVSHVHRDHWTPEILKILPCMIQVMAGRPKFFDALSEYNAIIELPALEWIEIRPGIRIFFVPNWHNTVDSSYLISNGQFVTYCGNDNFLDENLCKAVANAVPMVDVAQVPVQFIHYYPHLLESLSQRERWQESTRLKKEHIAKAKMFKDIVNPRMMVPTGGNLLYCDGPLHPLNVSLASQKEVSFAFPMSAGDYVLKNGEKLQPYWNSSPREEPEYKQLPDMDFDVELTPEEFRSIADRVGRAPSTLDESHWIIINGIVRIEPWRKMMFYPAMDSDRDKKNVIEFWFDAPVFHRWARNEISFEAALGTRRFKYYRAPNIYNFKLIEYYSKFL